jgi:hypothetical protein
MSFLGSMYRRTGWRAPAVALPVVLAALACAPAASAGSFVIGNSSASIGSSVTFWGAQWWKLNSLTGGPAPASFKGYANSFEGPPVCGLPWTTDPGNSSSPPAAPLPEYIDVIVSSSVRKEGPTIYGDAPEVVLVRTNPGYAPNPGHPGTGTVVQVVCPAPVEEEPR